MKHIYTLLSLSPLPAWTSTIPSRKWIEIGENMSDLQQAHMVECQHFGMSFNGQTLSVLPSNKSMRHIIKEYMPALFQQTGWCLMPSTCGCIPFYAVTAFSLQGVAWKDHWMLMNNKMCHFPLEFAYLSHTVKNTCLFSSACIYTCVKIRTVKPDHMLRQYVVLLVFFHYYCCTWSYIPFHIKNKNHNNKLEEKDLFLHAWSSTNSTLCLKLHFS